MCAPEATASQRTVRDAVTADALDQALVTAFTLSQPMLLDVIVE
jgi:hypothetical protein